MNRSTNSVMSAANRSTAGVLVVSLERGNSARTVLSEGLRDVSLGAFLWGRVVRRAGSQTVRAALMLLGLLVAQAGIPGVSIAAPVYLDTVTNREWRQVLDTVGYSFDQMNNGFSGGNGCSASTGACLGNLGGSGPSLDGWTWATELEVRTLFHNFAGVNYIPGFDPIPLPFSTYFEDDSLWAPNLVDSDLAGADIGVFNATTTTVAAGPPAASVMGITRTFFEPGISASVGMLRDISSPTVGDRASTEVISYVEMVDGRTGFWLSRPRQEVPIPSTPILLLTGLGALAWRIRRGGVSPTGFGRLPSSSLS